MRSSSYQASAPGSLMLFGEHAVLAGKFALVAAVNKRMRVTLTPRLDQKIKIFSRGFANFSIELKDFKIVKPYQFVLTAIQQYLPKIATGFNLKIDSDFAATLGLGSSAAVTVVTLAVLELWLKQREPQPLELLRLARGVIQKVQGVGSGADAASSIFGGVVLYRMRPLHLKKIATSLPLTVIYSGSKMATSLVIEKVNQLFAKKKNILRKIYVLIGQCTLLASSALQRENWHGLGELMNLHQSLQDALGVSNAHLSELIFALRAHSSIDGAKISGSGLGDCVIGLGSLTAKTFPQNKSQARAKVQQLEVKIARQGLVMK
jgi:mevalonate kinase